MKAIFSLFLVISSYTVFGQNNAPVQHSKGIMIDTNLILVFIAVLLLIPIRILSLTFTAAARRFYLENKNTVKTLIPIGFIMMTSCLIAQGEITTVGVSKTNWGLLNNTMTIMLLSVIGLELLLITFFSRQTKEFMHRSSTEAELTNVPENLFTRLKAKWTQMNFRPMEEEQALDTGHSYDGIRELDNIAPPWFTTAFIISILLGIVYVYRYQISKSAPNQFEEYTASIELAEIEHEAYLKTAANAIDETNVKIMTGADLDEGKKTFLGTCAACHRADAGGQVGPNLTDDYWLHGGGLKDIFKTIKYGYPEKGMISWKSQLSPSRIAQVSSYILTLHGSNPAEPKEKQGILYVAEKTQRDTVAPTEVTKEESINH